MDCFFKKTKLPWFTLLLIVCCQGCADPERSQLAGKWVLERPERIMDRIESHQPSTADSDSTVDSDGDSRMTLEFRANGHFSTRTAMGNMNREKNGTWEVISFDESGAKMTIRCKIGAEETDHPIEFLDGSSIRMLPPNMAGLSLKMRFRRAD